MCECVFGSVTRLCAGAGGDRDYRHGGKSPSEAQEKNLRYKDVVISLVAYLCFGCKM